MSLQDAIDAIDPSKPVNASPTQKPTLKSVRDNFSHIKGALQSLAAGNLSFLSTNQSAGGIPTVVGSIRLAAGTYPAPSASIGCGNPLYAATLELRKMDGTVLATIGGSAGGVAWHTAAAGFTLTATTEIDLVLYSNHSEQTAFILSFTF